MVRISGFLDGIMLRTGLLQTGFRLAGISSGVVRGTGKMNTNQGEVSQPPESPLNRSPPSMPIAFAVPGAMMMKMAVKTTQNTFIKLKLSDNISNRRLGKINRLQHMFGMGIAGALCGP